MKRMWHRGPLPATRPHNVDQGKFLTNQRTRAPSIHKSFQARGLDPVALKICAKAPSRRSREAECTALRNAKLAERDKSLLQAAIVEKLSDPDLSAQELQDFALRTRIKMVDLNNDGKPEIIAQGSDPYNCSPTGNCPFWVFQKGASGYASLLESFGQVYTIENHRTNGYRDLVVAMHGSATQQTVYFFRFEKGGYLQAACYEFSWPFSDGEPPRTAEEPDVARCH
jgi:hypothetical protein